MGRKEIVYSPNPLGSHAKRLQGGVALLFLFALLFAGIGCGIYMLSCYISSGLMKKRKQKRLAALRRQTQQRRRIRKVRSLNPPPSPEDLLVQWNKTRDSIEDMLRFGAMLLDLEPSVDNGLVIDHEDGSGRIRGRKPGIKGWLADHSPQIGYKTAMRYKALAQKAREVAGLEAPVPVTWALLSEAVHNSQREPRAKMASNADCSLAKAQKKLAHVLKDCVCVQHVQTTFSQQLGCRHYVLSRPRKTQYMGRFAQPVRKHPKSHLFLLRTQTHKLFESLPLREQELFIEELFSLGQALKEKGTNAKT
ncbi:MAG: hypothetical protein WCP12_07965 [bacterium]